MSITVSPSSLLRQDALYAVWLAEDCPGLTWMAMVALGSIHDAEEAVQETHLKFWEALRSGTVPREREEMKRFLREILRCRIADGFRKRRSHASIDAAGPGPEIEHALWTADTSPSGAARRGEAQRLVREAIEALPTEQQKAAVCLYFLEGLSIDRTAAAMGTTPRSAWGLIVRARKNMDHLREKLS
jgi:RNA polymerase sigma factor (sigma-70 family)